MPTYKVTINDKDYTVVVPDPKARPVRAIVNGETFEVNVDNNTSAAQPTLQPPSYPQPESARAHPIPASSALTVQTTPANSSGVVNSPLPGIIVSIGVSEGDRVEKGQELCVLEAMKMNNPIRSTVSGRVSKIFITIGQQVQHGVPLMSIEV